MIVCAIFCIILACRQRRNVYYSSQYRAGLLTSPQPAKPRQMQIQKQPIYVAASTAQMQPQQPAIYVAPQQQLQQPQAIYAPQPNMIVNDPSQPIMMQQQTQFVQQMALIQQQPLNIMPSAPPQSLSDSDGPLGNVDEGDGTISHQ